MNHFISLSEAVEITTRFRNNRETILKPEYQNQNILCIAETFDREAIDALLAQPDCKKLRIYGGMMENDEVHSVLVGVNSNNEDILPAQSLNSTGEEDELIVEMGQRCPDDCGPDSPLNP